MAAARIDLTWGPIDYHRRSLENLQVGREGAVGSSAGPWSRGAGQAARQSGCRQRRRGANQPPPPGAAARPPQEAMRRTRKMCAIMLDTLGREVMIRRPFRWRLRG
jgi:hypothetical protein